MIESVSRSYLLTERIYIRFLLLFRCITIFANDPSLHCQAKDMLAWDRTMFDSKIRTVAFLQGGMINGSFRTNKNSTAFIVCNCQLDNFYFCSTSNSARV